MEQLNLFKEVDNKVCTECKINKPFSEYHKNKNGRFGLHSKCKCCLNFKTKEWNKNNKEYKREKSKEYYKEYYKNNKKHKKHKKEYSKKWRENNKEYFNQYSKTKKEQDPLFKLTGNIRTLIYHSLKNKGYSKTSKTADYLGCDYDTLLAYLNDNKYGFIYGDEGLDIDHIIPLASAKNENDIFYFSYYKNLMLLPAEFNRHIKKDRKMTLEEIDTELTEWLNKKP